MIEELVLHDVPVTRVYVDNDEMAAKLNRPIGHYSTLYAGSLTDETLLENICCCLTEELRQYMSPYVGKSLCVCGVGNEQQIADSFGPGTAKRIVPNLPMQSCFEKVVTITPGTLGKTNIETTDAISSIVSSQNVSCVLAIDATVCSELDNLGKTITLTDTGLNISHRNDSINHSTIGVPVIGIGLPTIFHTKHLGIDTSYDNYVTCVNIDAVIRKASLTVACAVMQMVYPELDFDFGKMLAHEIALL